MEKIRKLWDPILIRWPRPPICYYPPIWELVINREKLDEPILKELVSNDPVPLKADMIKYFNTRIQLTKSLIEEKKLDPRIGKMAIRHFEDHLNELEAMQ